MLKGKTQTYNIIMSLIYGICLPRKIYLISDSRLTTRAADDTETYSDDFGKWLNLTPKLGVVVANNAHQASWMLQKITPSTRTNGMGWDFTDLEKYLNANLQDIAHQYYAETGQTSNSVGFIFGGFENTKHLEIDAGRMGDAMSAPLIAQEGKMIEQTVDMDVVNAFSKVLHSAAKTGKQVQNGTMFEVPIPRPRVLAVSVRATNTGAEVIYEDTKCYDGVVFNPQYKTERVELPSDFISQLEYRDKTFEQGQATIYEDCRNILLYTDKLLDEKQWPTVGGEVIPYLITPEFAGFATGPYIRVKNGQQYLGGIGTNDKGEFHYYDRSGKMIPYRFIYGYIDGVRKGSTDIKMDLLQLTNEETTASLHA